VALPDEPTSPEVMVPNPQRAELTRFRAEVAAARTGIATALDGAAKKMADKVTTSEARVIHNDQRTRGY
jgi:hypothetical protein